MKHESNAQALRAACETLYEKAGRRWLSASQFDSAHERIFGTADTSVRHQAVALGIINQGEKGDYCLIGDKDLLVGRLHIPDDGYPYAEVENLPDVPLRREQLLSIGVLLDGAEVKVQKPMGRSRYGNVVSAHTPDPSGFILAEARSREKNWWLLDSIEPRTLRPIRARMERGQQVTLGERYQVALSGKQHKSGYLDGHIVGPGDTDRSLEDKIQQILHKFGLQQKHVDPEPAELEIWQGLISEESTSSYRKDLRKQLFYTIDGQTARDFDDAIALERFDGGYRVSVAVADVAAYVTEGSFVDTEARERGTSVYFPDYVLPMLPHELSDNLCSLRPEEDRLALVVVMEFDENGRRLSGRLEEALICSHYRLTYSEVKHFLDGETPKNYSGALAKSLQNLAALTNLRRVLRAGRGGLDFDLPEPFIQIGMRGEVTAILRRERTLAHFMIEEMMIAANESVAEVLTQAGYPVMYRNHGSPPLEKRQFLSSFLASRGIQIGADWEGRDLQRVIESFAGLPVQKTVQMMTLRSMAQASYGVENIGHWGLVSPCYCHFTSPIRRYPDLLNHRLVKRFLRRGDLPPAPARKLRTGLEKLTGKLGDRERNAEAAERAMAQHLKARYAARHIGHVSNATITGVVNFGIFAELESPFCEGMVHVSRLGGDNWIFEEKKMRFVGRRSKRTWSLGDTIRVRITRADVERDRVDLEPVELQGE